MKVPVIVVARVEVLGSGAREVAFRQFFARPDAEAASAFHKLEANLFSSLDPGQRQVIERARDADDRSTHLYDNGRLVTVLTMHTEEVEVAA